ncbi:BrnT family toxin [Methanophagales archaeon]|nr:MAG: BrnT family toxin [Methanophagales archaeon]
MRREIIIQWDRRSLDHISKHEISEKEVERAVNGRILIRNTSRKGKKLKEVIGESHGRILFIVLELYGDKYRVITARDATQTEKKLYKIRGK